MEILRGGEGGDIEKRRCSISDLKDAISDREWSEGGRANTSASFL